MRLGAAAVVQEQQVKVAAWDKRAQDPLRHVRRTHCKLGGDADETGAS